MPTRPERTTTSLATTERVATTTTRTRRPRTAKARASAVQVLEVGAAPRVPVEPTQITRRLRPPSRRACAVQVKTMVPWALPIEMVG